jgi:hypothetical protein
MALTVRKRRIAALALVSSSPSDPLVPSGPSGMPMEGLAPPASKRWHGLTTSPNEDVSVPIPDNPKAQLRVSFPTLDDQVLRACD